MHKQTQLSNLPNRSIPQILRRQRARERSHVREFPPDFVHGAVKLDELYGAWGGWAERVVFIQGCYNAEGRLVAASIAHFEDWFLCVEHRSGDAAVVAAWLSQNLANAELVVELSTRPGASLGEDEPRWILIDCERGQFEGLERSELCVTRDARLENETWTQTAETDLLSLICLSARLSS